MKKLLNLAIIVLFVAATATAQSYTVEPSKSVLKWTGKKVTGEHYGKITLKEGTFEVKNDKVASGKFVIDMNSITCEDLEGEWSTKLVGHLKSDDFFGTTTFPEAVLVLKESTKLVNGKTKIKADLTIKGITNKVEFDATQTGNEFSAVITVDRSLFNIRYGSGKFFENLGDKTIYDDFTLDVKLVAKK